MVAKQMATVQFMQEDSSMYTIEIRLDGAGLWLFLANKSAA